MLYRKKPVVIEARQYDGTETCGRQLVDWIGEKAIWSPECGLQIRTLETSQEGWFNVSPRDFVIKGIQGEFYACKPDIFAQTYEVDTGSATKWMSFCSRHREKQEDCKACNAGMWLDEASLYEQLKSFLWNKFPDLWREWVNRPGSEDGKHLEVAFPNLKPKA